MEQMFLSYFSSTIKLSYKYVQWFFVPFPLIKISSYKKLKIKGYHGLSPLEAFNFIWKTWEIDRWNEVSKTNISLRFSKKTSYFY